MRTYQLMRPAIVGRCCCVCHAGIGTAARSVRLTPDRCQVVHPDDATESNSVQGWLGPMCDADWPAEYQPKQ